MKSLVCLLLFMVPTMAKECVKIDQCSCELDDGTGLIDIAKIGMPLGEPPLIKDIPDSPGSSFNYSFNPCIPFTEGTCENVAGCQIDTTTKVGFDIGAAAQVNFSLDSVTNHLVGTYKSGDHKRSSVVQYICDPRIDPPQASVQGEIEPLTYHFSIKSKYACASSVPVTAKCIQIDQCSCRFDDGRGTVDLTTIAKHGVPLIMDAQAGPYYYSFNPCFSFNEGTCLDVAGCQYENISGIYIDIAAAFPMTLSYDGTNIVGNYASSDGARKTIVTYVCDPTVNTTIAIANGELWFAKYSFTIISKDICPKNTTGSSSDVRTTPWHLLTLYTLTQKKLNNLHRYFLVHDRCEYILST